MKRTLLALLLLSAAAGAQTPPTTKRVPPAGVAIPANDRAELEVGVKALGARAHRTREKPAPARCGDLPQGGGLGVAVR